VFVALIIRVFMRQRRLGRGKNRNRGDYKRNQGG
jgi:hypothetical protein